MISYMDRGTIYPRRLTQWLEQLAAEAGIPTQKKTLIAGGNRSPDRTDCRSRFGGHGDFGGLPVSAQPGGDRFGAGY